MGRERAAKMGIALDRLFGCCLFIGCIGLSAQIYNQNKSLEILKEKYDKTVQLSEERMRRIDALHNMVADRLIVFESIFEGNWSPKDSINCEPFVLFQYTKS